MAILLLMLCLGMINVVQMETHDPDLQNKHINNEIKTKFNMKKNMEKDNGNLDIISKKLNLFSFKVQKTLSRVMGDDYNIIFSPLSIFTAFSAICVGAKGKTKQQMARALNWTDNEDFLNSMLKWYKYMSLNDGTSAQLLVANRVWVANNTILLHKFKEDLKDYFDTKIKKIDVDNPGKSEKRINDWVAKKTRFNILDLFPSGSINAMTRLVLVNAVYFKGKWANEFKKERTIESKFCLLSNNNKCVYDNTDVDNNDKNQVNVSYMTKEAKFPIAYGKDATLLEMPYAGKLFSMLFVLPHNISYTNKLERKMTPEFLNNLIGKLWKRKLLLQIPKFEINQQLNLDGHLLKMHHLFDGDKADLSGINGKRDLYVSKAVHKAVVKVDEAGTVASGATGVVISSRSRTEEFILNRPFLFYIMHRPSKSIIFSGKIMNPKN